MKKNLWLVMALTLLLFSGCSTKQVTAGYDGPKEVSTYFTAPLISTQEVKTKLSDAGFSIISESKVSKKKLTSIVFTHPSLIELSNRSGRGFLAGALRVTVNDIDNKIRISNPRYFVKAFLQDDYKIHDEKPALTALHKAFENLTPSADKWDFDGLSSYQFMISRPYYQDTIIAAEGETDTLRKNLEKKAKKNLIFKLEISEGRTLYGVNLHKRTMKFVDKIGIQNAGILPWMILVEENKATVLRADYMIAISYPLLDLGGFMGIMTVPGAVEKDVKKYFK